MSPEPTPHQKDLLSCLKAIEKSSEPYTLHLWAEAILILAQQLGTLGFTLGEEKLNGI